VASCWARGSEKRMLERGKEICSVVEWACLLFFMARGGRTKLLRDVLEQEDWKEAPPALEGPPRSAYGADLDDWAGIPYANRSQGRRQHGGSPRVVEGPP